MMYILLCVHLSAGEAVHQRISSKVVSSSCSCAVCVRVHVCVRAHTCCFPEVPPSDNVDIEYIGGKDPEFVFFNAAGDEVEVSISTYMYTCGAYTHTHTHEREREREIVSSHRLLYIHESIVYVKNQHAPLHCGMTNAYGFILFTKTIISELCLAMMYSLFVQFYGS